LVDRYVVQARITKIREYVALLRKIRALADEETFLKDPLVYGNAERYLQLAIQAVLDISNHVVADMKLSLPPDNRALLKSSPERKCSPDRYQRNSFQWQVSAMCWFMNISKLIANAFTARWTKIWAISINSSGQLATYCETRSITAGIRILSGLLSDAYFHSLTALLRCL
jgi:hypothetical protein